MLSICGKRFLSSLGVKEDFSEIVTQLRSQG